MPSPGSTISCGSSLGGVDANWRDGAVSLVETPITERYAELEMNVRGRLEKPDVTVREHSCQACAASLSVEVVAGGLEQLAAPQLLAGAGVS